MSNGPRILLNGIRVSGFRSIAEPVSLPDFSNVNILIGKNNSGKSNLLLAIHRLIAGSHRALLPGDWNLSGRDMCLQMQLSQGQVQSSKLYQALEAVFGSNRWNEVFANVAPIYAGLEYPHNRPSEGQPRSNILDSLEWARVKQLASHLGTPIPSRSDAAQSELYSRVAFSVPNLPPGSHLPHHRLIGSKDAAEATHKVTFRDGNSLIHELAHLPNRHTTRPVERRQGQMQFAALNTFVREILNENDARIETTPNPLDIIICLHNREVPIADVGAGISQILILAAMATMRTGEIVTIEEPEINLHPELQRKLIRYLVSETSNQYFITTHSNAILDVPGTTVFHVELVDGVTRVQRVAEYEHHDRLLKDLGYTASDLLQSNCVIWVEGPSDRIYLRHWIEQLDREQWDGSGKPSSDRFYLMEDLHYSMMFYGGSLISHLTCKPYYESGNPDEPVDRLIKLSRMNRNTAVVFDSDRSYARKPLKPAQKRIRDELSAAGRLCWVTSGREIENYIQKDVYCQAIQECHPRSLASLPKSFGQFDCISRRVGKASGESLNKVDVARICTRQPPDWSVLDLRRRVTQLVEFIRRANNIPNP